MPAASRLKCLYLSYFSQPVGDRQLFRILKQLRPRKILELGIGDASRAGRLLSVAQRYSPGDELRYVAVDLFEARPTTATSRLSLKQAHALFKASGVRVQLVPGDPYAALSRIANSVRENDLVLVSADQDSAALEKAWFYLPRMLHERSMVLRQSADAPTDARWEQMPLADIEARSAEQQSKRRVA